MASSGVGARRVKIRGQPPPGMSRRHHSSSCGVGARAGGCPRDAPPHPFKVKLGDHFSAAPEITPGWGLAPGCGTHGTPHRCRSELVGLPRQYTTISATMQLSAVPRPRPSCNSRKRTLKDVIDVCDNFVNELEAHCRILSVSEERYTQNSVAAYADAGCSAAAEWKEPAAQEN